MTKVNIGGINEIKYPASNNHESLFDFIHCDINVIIKRGNASITKTIGAINKRLCSWNCSRRICLNDCWVEILSCWWDFFVIRTIDYIKLDINGPKKWKICIAEL